MLTEVEEGMYDVFNVDNVGGAREALRRLVELGHRRIGILQGLPENREVQQRLQGYRQALEEAGIEPDPALEAPGTFTQASGFDDIVSARYSHPPLTTIHVPMWDLGRRAINRLIEHIDEEASSEPHRFTVSTHLEVRSSTTG